MKNNSTMSGWYHKIVAMHDSKVISVTTRDFQHEVAGLLHNFLRVQLNTEKDRTVTQTNSFSYAELKNVLLLFTDYQKHKEIEFLKVCLDYFSKHPNVEKLKFTFHNN